MRLYIGNLPYSASEADLESWLADNGVATDTINFVRDRFSGESRGFGFVEIQDDNEAETAIQNCHGKEFMGRNLVMNEARPKLPAMRATEPFEGQERGRRAAEKRGRRRPPRW